MASRAAARALSSASASATAAAAAAVSLGSSNCLLDLHLSHIPSFYPSSLIYTLSVYIKTTLLAYFYATTSKSKHRIRSRTFHPHRNTAFLFFEIARNIFRNVRSKSPTLKRVKRDLPESRAKRFRKCYHLYIHTHIYVYAYAYAYVYVYVYVGKRYSDRAS